MKDLLTISLQKKYRIKSTHRHKDYFLLEINNVPKLSALGMVQDYNHRKSIQLATPIKIFQKSDQCPVIQ